MEDYSKDKDILEKFGRNITNEVKKNKVDPVIGRDQEIRNIIIRRSTLSPYPA